jgi:hypothetical protein
VTDEAKSLKKSLEEAAKRVENWPAWKKALESATTELEYSRVPGGERSVRVESKIGDYATVKMARKTGYIFLAWQHGYWSAWHIALRDDLTKLKCKDAPGKKDPVQTSDRVKFTDVCNNCLMNLARALV